MTSPYLNNTRSMEELDALLEESLGKATGAGKKLIADEVRSVIGSIGAVCKDAVAGIEEKTSRIVADVASSVEAARTELQAETEKARQKIESLMDDPSQQHTSDVLTSMISETSYFSLGRMTKCANTTIKNIRLESSNAIVDLRKKTADSYKKFRTMAAEAAEHIRKRVEKAAIDYDTAKKKNKNKNKETRQKLKTEAQSIITDAETASKMIDDAKAETVALMNDAMQAASERIEKAQIQAALDIQGAKEKAETKLNDVAKLALARLDKT